MMIKIFRVFAFVMASICGGNAAVAEPLPEYVIEAFGHPPNVPEGPLAPEIVEAIDALLVHSLNQSAWDETDLAVFDKLAAGDDPRVAWLLTDMMRFSWRPAFGNALGDAAVALTGIELETLRHRAEIIEHLIAWDMLPYPNYLDHKRAVFTRYIEGWDRIMVPGDIAWEQVSWGGVNIDDRAFGDTDRFCDCIPAVDNPEVNTAEDATWLGDNDIVFGIVINGEARAYPRRIMEVREMVNDTLGGRDLGIPYCTLCGAAQAFFTDDLQVGIPRPVLRTSGLLIRSNKVMFDVNSYSVFDTFRGIAVTGPLRGIQLNQASVLTTTWGDWRAAYPDTTVLVEALALGRDFDLRNTRDANGPIFPVGDVDPRLGVQDDVVGIITDTGQPIAFERGAAFLALSDGQDVALNGVRLVLDGGGIRAVDETGRDLGSHQAFWFAWSQFHPETLVWPPQSEAE